MSKVYILVQLEVFDRESYDNYAKLAVPLILQHGGRTLVADDHPEVIEGTTRPRILLIEFPSEESAKRFYNSPENQAIAPQRKASSKGDIILLHAFHPPAPSK